MGTPTVLSYVGACEQQKWHLQLWRRDGSDPTRLHIPFRCRSWRHAGECRQWCGKCDFVRCLAAIEANEHWTNLVLTYPHRDWPRVGQLFRFGLVSWARFRKRIVREFGPMKYIQTWEVHRSGYPHVNVVVSNEWFHWRARVENVAFIREWLRPAVKECGFGKELFVTPVYNAAGMAGYLTKLARELTGASVKNQVPVNAPRHFRRLRASKGLLPKRFKTTEFTGRIIPTPLPKSPPSGEMVNADIPAWLKERLAREEIECLQQPHLQHF